MATTALDSDGQPNEGRKKLPQLEDKWSYMGACMGRSELRHRIDTCKHWRSGGFGRLLGKRPGDGYPTAAETAQEQAQ